MSKHRFEFKILVSFSRNWVLRGKFFYEWTIRKELHAYVIYLEKIACVMFDFSFHSLASCSVNRITQLESLLIILKVKYNLIRLSTPKSAVL